MKSAKVKLILKRKANRIAATCINITAGFDEEAIHQFRKEIKDLRAFLRLLAIADKTCARKIPGKIKQLYTVAGNIREAQLQMKELVSLKIAVPGYMTHLHDIINREKSNWSNHYSEKPFIKLIHKLKSGTFHELKTSDWQGSVKHNVKRIKKQLKNVIITDTKIHAVRKRIKDINCTSALFVRKFKPGSIAAAIGDYNDKRVMLDQLSAFSRSVRSKNEQQVLQLFCNEEKRHLLHQKNILLSSLPNQLKAIAAK